MKTVLWAGTSEIQFAQAYDELVQRSCPGRADAARPAASLS